MYMVDPEAVRETELQVESRSPQRKTTTDVWDPHRSPYYYMHARNPLSRRRRLSTPDI